MSNKHPQQYLDIVQRLGERDRRMVLIHIKCIELVVESFQESIVDTDQVIQRVASYFDKARAYADSPQELVVMAMRLHARWMNSRFRTGVSVLESAMATSWN